MPRRATGAACVSLVLLGCGGDAASPSSADRRAGLPPDYQPIRAGRTPAYRLPALTAATARGRPVAGLPCTRRHGPVYGVHVELYARRLVVPVPAGIGVAAPQRRSGVYVHGGACTYPVRTFEPTGVFVIDRTARAPTLATLFAIWGPHLSRTRLAGFHGPVAGFVDGRRWSGAPGAIPLRAHAQVVLEIGGAVIPHPAYRFAPGL